MAEKFEIEEFNTTEIDIEQVKKSDKKDDWEFVSKFEADTYSVPFISFPKMHEVDETDIIPYRTGLESDTQGNLPHTMNERKDEVNKEQLPPYQHYEERKKLIDEEKEVKFFPTLSEQESKEIEKELYEAMQDFSSQEKDCDEEVRLAIDEAMRDDLQTVEKNKAVGTKANTVIQDVLQKVQENEKLRSEMEEAIDEAMRDDLQTVEENKAVGTKANTVIQDVLQKVQENERLRSEMEEAINETMGEKANAATEENANAGSSAQYMKSQTLAIDGESPTKANTESGGHVVQREFIETFNKILEFNTIVPDKVSTETAKDKFAKDKDLRLKTTQSEMESLIDEELNNPSAEGCKKI